MPDAPSSAQIAPGAPQTQWRDATVTVSCRIISRYAWTTASIDVMIDGATVLRTGGVRAIASSVSNAFQFRGHSHQATVSWTRGSLRSFPFKLTIDDELVLESRVPIDNWWMAWLPALTVVALVTLWGLLHR